MAAGPIDGSVGAHARAYLNAGWSLVAMPVGSKGPTQQGWNEPRELISTVARLETVEQQFGGAFNMGVVLEPSGLVSIDIDNEAWARHVFETFGLDYDAVLAKGMRIVSPNPGRGKVLFKAPMGVKMTRITWPRQDDPTKRIVLVEFRAGLSQDVLPPSIHPLGAPYVWTPGQMPWDHARVPEVPEALVEFWRRLDDDDLRDEIGKLCPWRQPGTEAKRYVQQQRAAPAAHQDVIGRYSAMCDVEAMLVDAGYKKRGKRLLAPGSQSKIPGVVVFNEGGHQKVYSHHGSDVLADGWAHDAFDLLVLFTHHGNIAAALHEAGRAVGADPPRTRASDQQREPQGPHPAQELLDRIASGELRPRHDGPTPPRLRLVPPGFDPGPGINPETVRLPDPMWLPAGPPEEPVSTLAADLTMHVLPDVLMQAPGFVSACTEWILATAPQPQRVLAFAAALSMAGLALGRKVATISGLRTNQMFICVARTGAGKDYPRTAIRKLATEAGMEGAIGPDEIASGAALQQTLYDAPNTICMIDEFGLDLKRSVGAHASSHEAQILSMMMRAHGSAQSVLGAKARADSRMSTKAVAYPCLHLYATTTPDTLFDALTSKEVVSGYINRMLVFFAPEVRPKYQRNVSPALPPASVTEWVRAAQMMHGGLSSGLLPSSPIIVHEDEWATRILDEFKEFELRKMDEGRLGMGDLWARAAETAQRLALVLACSRHDASELKELAQLGQLHIDGPSADRAVSIVRFLLEEEAKQFSARLSDSDFDYVSKKVLLRVAASEPTGILRGDLIRACSQLRSLPPKDRDSVLDGLVEQNAIKSEAQLGPRGGRPTFRYRLG